MHISTEDSSHQLPARIFYKNKLYKNTQAEICPKIKNKLRTITSLKF